jgi:ubiquinone/menaquinone biosynthesis C-methylase UbiE
MCAFASEDSTFVSSGMSEPRIRFYQSVISKWLSNKNSSVLIVGGGETDYKVFRSLGFTNVVISNLDSRLVGDEFAPYQWSFQKAEELNYDEQVFDFVVVHAALHHCESPHRALLEMYRVAKLGVIAFESRDSFLMKLLEIVGLTPSYEHLAVYCNNGKFGGVNNTEIPNYIYRWTEREVEKTIHTYAPYAKHAFHYSYGNDLPATILNEKKLTLRRLLVLIAKPFYQVFASVFAKQQKLFAFYVKKPDLTNDLHDWIIRGNEALEFNHDWAAVFYR